MDAKNTPLQHILVGIFSLAFVVASKFLLDTAWSTSFARVSFFLLFLALIIGPIMRFKKPTEHSTPLSTPWSWRGELGIWFTLTGLIHFIIVLAGRPLSELIKIGGAGYSLTNLIGLVALFWALVLTATSSTKVIVFLGVKSWKWLHSLTYVIFYLVAAHFMYFQFFSTYGKVGPDWFGYVASIMTIAVIVLQIVGFIIAVKKYRLEEASSPAKK